MNNAYYIKIQIGESNNASSKAVNDCNQILDSHGVKPLCLKIKKQGNKYLKKINNYLHLLSPFLVHKLYYTQKNHHAFLVKMLCKQSNVQHIYIRYIFPFHSIGVTYEAPSTFSNMTLYQKIFLYTVNVSMAYNFHLYQ